MTLHDLLDDVARSEPVGAPGLAERAWADGRRRRRQARAAVAVAAALALVALVVPGLSAELPVPQVARSSADGVDGHPDRISRQWWLRELPDRPGPLAALLQTVEERGSYDEPSGWQAVRADGHRWRLPGTATDDQVPALSRDGLLLAYLESDNGPLVVRDLGSGARAVVPEIGGHIPPPSGVVPARYQQQAQSPSHWSPDGRHLLLIGAREDHLLLDVSGGTVEPLPRTLGQPAGWLGDDRIVWLHGGGDGTGTGSAPVRARTTDLRGKQVADLALPGTQGWFVHQSLGVVSGDGQRLAVLSDGSGSTSTLHRFFLDGGLPFAEPVPVDAQSCGMAWGTTSLFGPVLPARDEKQRFLAVEARAADTEPHTVVEPAIGGRCLVWAADAVDGPARGPLQWLLGTDQSTLAWWWRELLALTLTLALALAGAGVATATAVRRRRAEPAASAG
jgi:hypothetical protein